MRFPRKKNHKKTKLGGKCIRKVLYHMAKSNDKIHNKRMDINCHIPDLAKYRKCWIKPVFISINLLLVRHFQQIPLY